MAFTGFDDDALAFYRELAQRNDRAFWLANRERYQASVAGPMQELAQALEPEFGEGRLFRPHRDVRFSADKSPYKLHAGLTLGGHGYIQVSGDGLAAGSGVYQFDRDQLARYRQAVDAPASGAALAAAVAAVRANGLDILVADRLKTVPRGFDADHPRVELLRYKGLVTWQEWGVPDWFTTPEAADQLTAFLRASEPVTAWLRTHVD